MIRNLDCVGLFVADCVDAEDRFNSCNVLEYRPIAFDNNEKMLRTDRVHYHVVTTSFAFKTKKKPQHVRKTSTKHISIVHFGIDDNFNTVFMCNLFQ